MVEAAVAYESSAKTMRAAGLGMVGSSALNAIPPGPGSA